MIKCNNYIKSKIKKAIYFLIVLLPISGLIYVSDTIFININQIQQKITENTELLERNKTAAIKNIIDNRIHQANIQNNFIKDKIINHIPSSDRESFVSDLHHDTLSTETTNHIINIIGYDSQMSNLFENQYTDHILFISNTEGIIENTSQTPSNQYKLVLWETINQNKVNKELTKDAIKKLVTKSQKEKVIFWESGKASNSSFYSPYVTSSYDTLMLIVDNMNSIDELGNYNLLIPMYVSLNNNDTGSTTSSSYDFIIVREINLLNAIKPYLYDINKCDTILSDYRYQMYSLLYITEVSGIVILLLLFGCVVIGVIKVNECIQKSNQ